MSEQELKNREIIIAVVATRQAVERGYETGFEDRMTNYDAIEFMSACTLD